MYNCEKTARRQNKWVSLLICWLIILGGYLLIRMVFLIFGMQLHLTAQGACLVLLPFIFAALYLRKCCKKQKTWFYILGLLHGGHGGNRKSRTVCGTPYTDAHAVRSQPAVL